MRTSDYPVDKQFTDRWSPRGFDSAYEISAEELHSLLEAARWAPSSSNEQPWKFYVAKDAASREKFNAFVNETNRTWASHASEIIVVTARKNFAASGAPNIHAWYDTGAAVMALVLEAQNRGLVARQMGGILRDVIERELAIDTAQEDIICCIALGKQGGIDHLLEKHRAMEKPNTRKPQSEFVIAV
jgi:nitroreductase